MVKDPMRVVSVTDPAVDLETMGRRLSDYIKTRDPDLVKEYAGDRASWFHVRRIPTSVYQSFVASAPEHEQNRRAFQVGCALVEHLVDMDGTYHATIKGTGKIRGATSDVESWRDDELDSFPPTYIDEIGSVARMRSILHPKAQASYQAPPTCLLGLMGRISQLAAKSEADAQALINGKRPPDGQSPNAPSSGQPSDAHATDPTDLPAAPSTE